VIKKSSVRDLAKLEAKRDIWQEVLDGVREIKAGRGKRTTVLGINGKETRVKVTRFVQMP